MLLEGSIRVELTAFNGRAVVLYRIAPGGTCVLTTSCLHGGDDYPAVAVCETPVRAWAIDAPVFERLLTDSPEFRGFVFASCSSARRPLGAGSASCRWPPEPSAGARPTRCSGSVPARCGGAR